jgi:SAM-dependent methyltransferase
MHSVNDYLEGPFKSIQGWCSPQLWQVIQPIHEFQEKDGPTRPVAEIGVHHGKFFIGLVKTKGAPKGNLAIDVFDMQQFNLDKSGKGSRVQFEKNLDFCGVPPDSVEIVQADSLTLSDEDLRDIVQKTGLFSFFSVDGCHMVEHTINDVRTAMRVTAPNGIIMVDDYDNPSWPGVQEGVSKMFFTDCPRYVPLLLGFHKLFLAHISYHAQYLRIVADFLTKNHPTTTFKQVQRFGYKSLTLTPNKARRLAEQDQHG